VIKTRSNDQFIADLAETFENLRRFKWKLNPKKCIFGVPSGKLLSFIVSNRGIEAYPTKVNAIRIMKPPRCKRDVMKLTGSMAALSRFISLLGDKACPSSNYFKRPISSCGMVMPLGLYVLRTILNEPNVVLQNTLLVKFLF
jgi:hypothetical protein